jgi:hypothetical protein
MKKGYFSHPSPCFIPFLRKDNLKQHCSPNQNLENHRRHNEQITKYQWG